MCHFYKSERFLRVLTMSCFGEKVLLIKWIRENHKDLQYCSMVLTVKMWQSKKYFSADNCIFIGFSSLKQSWFFYIQDIQLCENPSDSFFHDNHGMHFSPQRCPSNNSKIFWQSSDILSNDQHKSAHTCCITSKIKTKCNLLI